MAKQRATIKCIVYELVEELRTLGVHLFSARCQQVDFNMLILNIPINWVILH